MYPLTDKKTIEYLSKKYNVRLKHGLGQNFLTNEGVLEDIALAAEAQGSGILEIGPGFGVLTAVLAASAEKVVAVEIDEELLPVLSETLAGYNNIEVIRDDILKCDLGKIIETRFSNMNISVAANLPYYITTPVIMKLISSSLPFKNIVVMVQKEVADRICAHAGNNSKTGVKEYGALTIAVNYYCEPSIVCEVSRFSFVPPPKVDSTVLHLRIREKPAVDVYDKKLFFGLVKASFAQRRKTLHNGLKNSGIFGSKEAISEALSQAGIAPMARGETLSIEEFATLANIFYKKRQNQLH